VVWFGIPDCSVFLTIPGESASVVEPTVRATSPKVDTSSAKTPMARALAAQPGSKELDDAPVDDDPDLLNFTVAVSRIGCWTSFLPQKYWPNPGKPDGLVW
jgi:hypothetical protein